MRYIVATDGSEESTEAVEYAAEHAAMFDATLEIVTAITPETEILDGELVLQKTSEAADEGERTLEDASERVKDTVSADLTVETTLLTGRPAEAIADRAADVDADAIFVGHRALSPKQEEVVGSVAKSLVTKADVPVTVVR
jgi:nucleotide-binding universal stress UspA family protein